MTEQRVEADSRSSVYVARNAKGEPQFAVKVYNGDSAAQIAGAREIALQEYRALQEEFRDDDGNGHGGAAGTS